MNVQPSKLFLAAACMCTIALLGCNDAQNKEQKPKDKVTINENPYPSTYTPIVGKPTLITNVTILDGIGNKIDKGAVLFSDGDYVFKDISKCSSCDGQIIVTKIFGESLTR